MTRLTILARSASLASALIVAAAALVPVEAFAQPPVGFGAPPGKAPAVRRGPPPQAAPRIAPRVQGPQPGFRGPVAQPQFRRGPGPQPGFRGPLVGAPQFRGPVAGPRGPGFRGPAVGFRRPPLGVQSFRGGRAAFIRGPHRIRRGNAWLPFVAIGTLGAIAIGSRYYTPYAYVDGPSASTCSGPTDDGFCELRLTEVPLEYGGSELQCVAYCPQDE